jgi:hypothetical protein
MSKSKLPNGGYTLTQGSNYMMDGFHFDTEYGGGPLEKARLPEAKGLSALPSGMIPTDSEGHSDLPSGLSMDYDLNIDEVTKEASQDISIIDHSWLATEPEPDLSGQRTMEEVYEALASGKSTSPEGSALHTLQESWGSSSTTGLDIIPNENRNHAKYQNTYSDQQSELPGDGYREKMEMKQRKLAYGHTLHEVLEDLEGKEILGFQKKLATDYGLHGRVYIKESAFPGLFNGRWNEVINKRCATAMYIIPKNPDCAFDRFLGMEVVHEVPWKKAASALLPKLESYGVKISSEGTAKEVLQRAFTDLMEGRVRASSTSSTWFQIQEDPTGLISLDKARRELKASQTEDIFIPSLEQVDKSRAQIKVERIASDLVKQGFLDAEQVSAIMETDLDPQSKKARLFEVASAPEASSSYAGSGRDVRAHVSERKAIEHDFKTRSEITLEQRIERAQSKIAQIVRAGLISEKEAIKVAKGSTPEEKVASIFNHIAYKQQNKSLYEGSGRDASYHTSTRRADDTPLKGSRVQREIEVRNNNAQAKIAGLIQANLISIEEVEKVVRLAKSPEDKVFAVLKHIETKVDRVSTYQGQVDNFEQRLSTDQLSQIQRAFFEKQAHVSKKSYEAQVLSQINSLVQGGLLSIEDFQKVNRKYGSLEARLQAIYQIISKPLHVKKASGQTGHYGSAFQKKAELNYTASDWNKAHEKVNKLVASGLLDPSSYENLKGISDPNSFVRKAFEMASKPSEATLYQGGETAHILNQKKSVAMSDTEKKVATWLRKKMSEGSAGEELDILLATRFSQNVLNEYGSRIASLRQAHEGLSGHAYVDADAYMTKGTEGCEKGAMVHRANQIPTLLKTSKCGSCVFNSGGTCQKYNKTIVASVDEIVENPEGFQRENIRLANASDSEQTASLFANNYDPSEFNLTASEEFSLEEAPTNKQLSDIIFGGFEV